MINVSNCPICDSAQGRPFLSCKDTTVSGDVFEIKECSSCGFKYTSPRPEEKDLGKYYESEDYISHSNTKVGLVNKLYQAVRQITLAQKMRLINGLNSKGSVLDIGCGTGEFLRVSKAAGRNTTGIEPSEKAREFAKANYGLTVFPENELKSIPNGSQSIITMWHVLEHVSNLNERVKELKRLLEPGGYLIVAVPNCASLDAKKYKEHWAAYDVPRHLYHFRPKDIKALFSKHGMKVTRVLPMVFDSFYVSMLSEKNKTGKTNFIKAMWNGLLSNLSANKDGESFSSQIYIIVRD